MAERKILARDGYEITVQSVEESRLYISRLNMRKAPTTIELTADDLPYLIADLMRSDIGKTHLSSVLALMHTLHIDEQTAIGEGHMSWLLERMSELAGRYVSEVNALLQSRESPQMQIFQANDETEPF